MFYSTRGPLETYERIVSLRIRYDQSFYHFLIEFGQRFALMHEFISKNPDFLLHANNEPPFARQFFKLFDIPKERVVGANPTAHIFAKEMMVHSQMPICEFPVPSILFRLREIVFDRLKAIYLRENLKWVDRPFQMTRKRRIELFEEKGTMLEEVPGKNILFINRKVPTRRISNFDELCEALRKKFSKGFSPCLSLSSHTHSLSSLNLLVYGIPVPFLIHTPRQKL